jgi:hypothetical protein
MSASLIGTDSSIAVGSAAIVNSSGAASVAATIEPTSMLRVRTIPSIGDTMTRLARSCSARSTCSSASAT